MLLARCCGTYYISSKRRLTAPYSVGALPVQAVFCGKLRFFCGGGRRGIHSVEADRLPEFAAAFVVEALNPHHPATFRCVPGALLGAPVAVHLHGEDRTSVGKGKGVAVRI